MRFLPIPSLFVIALAAGCGSEPISADGWVTDLVVTGPDHRPLPPRLTAKAGDAVDVVVGFRPGTPDPAAFPDRKVRDPGKWRLRAEVLDSSGTLQAAQPVASLYGELHGFDWRGSEEVPGDGPDRSGKVIWTSPEPTQEIREAQQQARKVGAEDASGMRYLWGRTRVPEKPGEYRFVIRLHPTADPHFSGETAPEMGPPIDLAEFPLSVTAGEGEQPPVTSRMYRAAGEPGRGRGPGRATSGAGAGSRRP